MAWTVTKKGEGASLGNYRIAVYDITTDSASALVPTGFSNLIGFSIGPMSVTTTSRLRGVINGASISFICAAGGDTFILTAYGN